MLPPTQEPQLASSSVSLERAWSLLLWPLLDLPWQQVD